VFGKKKSPKEYVTAIEIPQDSVEQVFEQVVDWADNNNFKCGLRYYMHWGAKPGSHPGERLVRSVVMIAIFENPKHQILFDIQWGENRVDPVDDWRNARTYLVRLDREY